MKSIGARRLLRLDIGSTGTSVIGHVSASDAFGKACADVASQQRERRRRRSVAHAWWLMGHAKGLSQGRRSKSRQVSFPVSDDISLAVLGVTTLRVVSTITSVNRHRLFFAACRPFRSIDGRFEHAINRVTRREPADADFDARLTTWLLRKMPKCPQCCM